jgi:catechol 2,3-dioxygenase-like lactoylglutathione lyase family enzyme
VEGDKVIVGAHSILYSTDAEADRAFLRDRLGLPHVDVGEGWLIFGLPPAEVAVHPAEENDVHEFYLMCDDIDAFVAEMSDHGIACAEIQNMGWGRMTRLTLPGGGNLGVYQPRHARPGQMKAARKVTRKAAKPAKPAKPRAAGKTSRKRRRRS